MEGGCIRVVGWGIVPFQVNVMIFSAGPYKIFQTKFPDFSLESDDFYLNNFWHWITFLKANCIDTTEFMRMKQDRLLDSFCLKKTIKEHIKYF